MSYPAVFNSQSYLKLEAARLGGAPLEVVHGEYYVGFVVREIPGTDKFDAISVYGYPKLLPNEPKIPAHEFFKYLNDVAIQNGIVSAYVRLGVDDVSDLELTDPLVITKRVGQVVTVDTTGCVATILANYRKNLRYDIKKSEGIVVSSSTEIDLFSNIYRENMLRVGAEDEYFFSNDYLESLLAIEGVELLLASDSHGVVAGGMFIRSGKKIYYHLGATAVRALKISPMKILLHNRICQSASEETTEVILGGGVGGHVDPLLKFKQGFSKEVKYVNALRIVFDKGNYVSLTKDPTVNIEEGFFPAYRKPESEQNGK